MSTSALDEVMPQSGEACDWGTDPDSGAMVVRLTNATVWSHNIYCEQPYTGPDGRYVLVGRTYDTMSGHYQLFAADLKTLKLTMIERDLPCEFVAHHAYTEWAYYATREGELRRVSLLTLERQSVLPAGTLKPYPQQMFETATKDDKWLIGYEPTGKGTFRGIALEVATGKVHVHMESPDNRNPHTQADTAGGTHLMQQLLPNDPVEVVVVTKDLHSQDYKALPIGGKHSAVSSGHMAWIADTGKIACAVGWDRENRRQDPRHPQGNLAIAGPDDASPRMIGAPDHAYYHVSVSRCGKYFVCDDFMVYRADAFNMGGRPGPVRIVIGSIVTGRTRVLLRDCQAYGLAGSSRYEPTPYFTADNKHVIYNGSPLGINQVFAARMPEGLLASLD